MGKGPLSTPAGTDTRRENFLNLQFTKKLVRVEVLSDSESEKMWFTNRVSVAIHVPRLILRTPLFLCPSPCFTDYRP